MKRTFLAFALSVLFIAGLTACSSRPSDSGNSGMNNGTSNSGTSNNGTSNNGTTDSDTSRPRPNTNSSGVGNGSSTPNNSTTNDVVTDDVITGDMLPDGSVPDDVVVDGEIVGENELNVDPVYHGARTYSVSRHTWDYCADCNGNVIDFGDEATVGDNARRMVTSVTDGARRVGRMMSDMAYDMTHM